MKPNVNICNGIQPKSQTIQHKKNFSRALREIKPLDKREDVFWRVPQQ